MSFEREKTELKPIVEQSIELMEEQGLNVDEWEIMVDSGELWLTVWFVEDTVETVSERTERLQTGLDIFKKQFLGTETSLPKVVNSNYETSPDNNAFSCWWS